MVYSGYIAFFGFTLPRGDKDGKDGDDREYKISEIYITLIKKLLSINIPVKQLILLAHKFDENNIWHHIPREIIEIIFSYVNMDKEVDDIILMDEASYVEDECISTLLQNHFNVNKIMKKDDGKSLCVMSKKCCYNDGTKFIGFELGSTNFVYRSEVEEYDSFGDYRDAQMKQLRNIQNYYDKNKKVMEEILKAMISTLEEYANRDEEFEVPEIKIYTFANDCESCS